VKRLNHPTGLFAILIIGVVLTGTGLGCAGSKQSRLRLQSLQSGKHFSQKFPQTYFSETSDGEYEIVLIDDGAPAATPKQGDAPLPPEQSAPLRQVVHVRVYWRPPTGTRPDHPSATNAAIDWYVTPGSGTMTEDRLHYQGAGFVQIFPKGDTAKVFIRGAQLAPVEATGEMRDPLGPTMLEGSIIARRNDTMVAAISVPARMESLSRVRQAGSVQPPSPPAQGNGGGKGNGNGAAGTSGTAR
jgi:hypothetical protein